MSIIYPETKFQQLVQKPTAQALLAYFKQQTEPVILRQIRKDVPYPQLDKTLDELIAHHVITRLDRRYTLSLPHITQWPEVPTDRLAEFKKLQQAYSPLVLAETCLQLLTLQPLTHPIEVTFELPCATVLENADFRFVTLNSASPSAPTLPNYFAWQTSEAPIPQAFAVLETLIGDVDPAFFFNQVSLIFEQVATGKLRTQRPSIFRESLLQTGILAEAPARLLIPEMPATDLPVEAVKTLLPKTMPEAFLIGHFFLRQLTATNLTYLIRKGTL